jgi:signal transduction histidine kinase
MRLVAKLTIMFLLVVILLTAGYGYLVVNRQRQVFELQQREDARRAGAAVSESLVVAWQTDGREGVVQTVRTLSVPQQKGDVRWVWFEGLESELERMAVPRQWLGRLRQGEILSFRHHDPTTGETCLYTYVPVDLGGVRRGGLEFRNSLSELDERTSETIKGTLGLVAAVATLSVLVMILAGIRIVGRPLESLIEKTKRVGKGDFSTPVRLQRHDELGQLAESLNQMCDQLATQQEQIENETTARLAAMQQLRHADRLKTVGRLAAGIAHELGTPLNVVSGRAGLIASGKLSEADVQTSAAAIKSEADKITAIIRQLLDFARRSTPQQSTTDLRHVVQQTVDLLRSFADKQHIVIRVRGVDQPRFAEVDARQIQQVLTNILVNAMHAMPEGGNVTITLDADIRAAPDQPQSKPQEFVRIAVQDEGSGIDQEHLGQIFEPFFTTKDVGEGTGLGLSIAYGIVQEHGGWIDVVSEPDQGSCFTIYLAQTNPAGA